LPKIKLYTGKRPKLRPEILLHPQIPKPLHGLSPRVIKGKEWWDRERQKAYKKSNYYCIACGVHKTEAKYHNWLEAHECYEFDYKKCTMKFIEAVALCNTCHSYIHAGRLQHLLDNHEISLKHYNEIILHGDNIIIKAKLKIPSLQDDSNCEWAKWRLIIGRRKYKSKFKNEDEWQKFYINLD